MKITAEAGSKTFEIEVDRRNGKYVVEVDGKSHLVDAQKLEGDFYTIIRDGKSYEVSVEARNDAYHVRHGAAEHHADVSAQSMHGILDPQYWFKIIGKCFLSEALNIIRERCWQPHSLGGKHRNGGIIRNTKVHFCNFRCGMWKSY